MENQKPGIFFDIKNKGLNPPNKWSLVILGVFTLLALFFATGQNQLFGLSLPVLFITGITFWWRRALREVGLTQKAIRLFTLSVIFALLVGAVGFYIYNRFDNNIKVYDDVNYYTKVVDVARIYQRSLPEFFNFMRDSLTHDYTYFGTILIAPIGWLTSYTYGIHCYAIFVLYYVPAVMTFLIFALRLFKMAAPDKQLQVGYIILTFWATLANINLLHPVLNGFIDVFGLMVIGYILNYTLYVSSEKYSLKTVLTLSGLSLTLILIRRWYAYFILGYYLCFFIGAALEQISERKFKPQVWKTLILTELSILGSCLLTLFLLNKDVIASFLLGNYGDQYEAYHTLETVGHLRYLMSTIGLFYILMAVVGFGILFTRPHLRGIGVSMLTIVIIATAAFFRVQTMDTHHQYLVIWFVLISACFFYLYCIHHMYVNRTRLTFFLGSLVAANLFFGVTNFTNPLQEYFNPVLTSLHSAPEVMTAETKTIQEISNYLKEKMNTNSEFAYVLGDTKELSSESFKRLEVENSSDNFPHILETATVDKRDGFPSNFFQAKYVVLSDPIASWYPEKQTVLTGAIDLIANDLRYQKNYRLVKTFATDNYQYQVYEKRFDTTKILVDQLREKFVERYGELPVLQPNYLLALSAITTGSNDYSHWDNTFYLYDEKISTIDVELYESFNTLDCVIRPEFDNTQLKVYTANKLVEERTLAGGSNKIQLDVSGYETVRLVLERAGKSVAAAYTPQGLH